MQQTKIIKSDTAYLRNSIETLYAQNPLVQSIIHALIAHGGTVLLVGGGVRDIVRGLPTHDLDFELYNLSPEQCETILKQFGVVSLVGKSYGVLRIHGLDIDWSLPRTDSAGRKPTVLIDPMMSFAQAMRRRDVTINAMGVNMHTAELIDPYGGLEDLKHNILRATDAGTFIEDPLRLYRVMQFISRFNMQVDASLNTICVTMDIRDVSRERIEAEFEKLLLKSERPSLGIRWLQTIGRLQEILPELFGTIGVPQRPDYHPEGDVFEHSMQALDAAAQIIKNYDNTEKKLILMYAALCHDLGKQDTTEWVDERWRSIGHEIASVPLTQRMLKRITHKKKMVTTIIKLVYHHMSPGAYVDSGAKSGTYKMLAHKLAPEANLALLSDLFLADRQGRNGNSSEPLTTIDPEITEFKKNAQQAGVLQKAEDPILLGADLLDIIAPGPELGKLLERAYEIQIKKGIRNKSELKKRILS